MKIDFVTKKEPYMVSGLKPVTGSCIAAITVCKAFNSFVNPLKYKYFNNYYVRTFAVERTVYHGTVGKVVGWLFKIVKIVLSLHRNIKKK